jgi:hypothetical protein
MSTLDKAIAHFDGLGTKKIEVPEWDTTIYATPLTLGEKSTLVKFAGGDDADFMVRMLILKAKDKKGKHLFDLNDKPSLLGHVHPSVLERVINEIADTTSVEDKEKK